jgi:YebC/PmpR family DNA-binding regulatory protein
MGKGWKTSIKVANAAKKGAVFTKVVREIQVSAKLGSPDPASNSRLRMAIEAARDVSCPNDTIERAIKKGAGLLEDTQIDELTYEGYGPHGVGVIVECQTDNRNRTAPEIRLLFKQHDGNMGESGSVQWMFQRVGLLEGKKTGTFDPEEEAIEIGAEEVYKNEDGSYMFLTHLESLESAREALTKRGWTVTKGEPSFKPNQVTELTDEQMKDVEEFLGELEAHDDTHRVHATLAFGNA